MIMISPLINVLAFIFERFLRKPPSKIDFFDFSKMLTFSEKVNIDFLKFFSIFGQKCRKNERIDFFQTFRNVFNDHDLATDQCFGNYFRAVFEKTSLENRFFENFRKCWLFLKKWLFENFRFLGKNVEKMNG